jgi:hypothetical protein
MAVVVLDRIVAVVGSARRAFAGRRGGRRPTWMAAIVLSALPVVAGVALVVALDGPERPAPVVPDPQAEVDAPSTPDVGGRESGADPAASRPSEAAPRMPAVAAPTPNTSPTVVTAPGTRAALRAAFAVEEHALLSYGAAVTISNPGSTRVTDWTMVITLPRESLDITSVSGARATREGATWTFQPDGTDGQVPGGTSVRVTFRVAGPAITSAPTACTIDGAACAGLPG